MAKGQVFSVRCFMLSVTQMGPQGAQVFGDT